MTGIGVIGYGYWGPNLARAISEVEGATLSAVADASPAALARAGRRHPGIDLLADWRELTASSAIDAVVIATPVHTHFEMALAALHAGKHVLVEKPMTDSPMKAQRLVDEARRRSLVLMVDHTFVYTGAVRTIGDLITKGSIGEVYCYDSTRVNLGILQSDVSVIWDLAVHDFAILDFLMPSRPVAISASAAAFLPERPDTMAHLSVFYEDGAMAHLNVNWMSPVKVRQTMIGGRQRMIIYDDMQNSEKVKVYDRGVDLAVEGGDLRERRISYRVGEMWAPAIPAKEALVTEIEHFVAAIDHGTPAPSDGESGLRVVEMLTTASRSAALRGHPVELGTLRKAS